MKTHKSIFSTPMTRAEALRSMVAGVAAGAFGIACSGGGEKRAPAPLASEGGRVSLKRNHRNGDEVSMLGFGCMRFPIVGGDRYTGSIDREPTREMLEYAYARGVNYFDTAWMYHRGDSEGMVGEVLKQYPRESFFLADKMPPEAKTLAQAKEIFATQLERCGVEWFDYYLCHSISRQYVFQNLYLNEGVLDYLLEEKRRGRIRQLGFSFHGDLALFEWLLSLPVEWDFVQIQMNWLDWRDETRIAEQLYNMLAEREIPVIVMEPIRGGSLIDLPPTVTTMLKQSDATLTPAAWALKFCASYPYVLTVLSGMSRMEHVVENCNTFTDFRPLSSEQIELLHRAAEQYRNNTRIDCTDCLYCMPCPYGVNIAGIFRAYNRCVDDSLLPNPDAPHDEQYLRRRRVLLNRYKNGVNPDARAEHCIGCNQCSPKCPQSLDIPAELKRIEELVERVRNEWK
jgi:predicted aldo/keto reductase-like oxidoreductase